jgi:hypothetical protein
MTFLQIFTAEISIRIRLDIPRCKFFVQNLISLDRKDWAELLK